MAQVAGLQLGDATIARVVAALGGNRRPVAMVGVPAERAVDWLRAIADTWRQADVPEAKADPLHAFYERIVVAGRTFVSARLTPTAYAHGLALALPEVVMARPTGDGRASAHETRRSLRVLWSQGRTRAVGRWAESKVPHLAFDSPDRRDIVTLDGDHGGVRVAVASLGRDLVVSTLIGM